MIDLHLHSTRSDGTDEPERIVELAVQAGCTALALTDHDTLGGIPLAQRRADELGIELVPGVELSCHTSQREVHLLGYFFDVNNQSLGAELATQRDIREDRNGRIVRQLQALGLPITLEEVEEIAGMESVGRPHIAATLLSHGVVSSIQEAFDRFLGEGRPGSVERKYVNARDAIGWITNAGGVTVLAHPGREGSGTIEAHLLLTDIEELTSYGLVGLEAHYSTYSPRRRAELVRMAVDFNLVTTGGSDYHGTYKPSLFVGVGTGDLSVSDQTLANLRERLPAR